MESEQKEDETNSETHVRFVQLYLAISSQLDERYIARIIGQENDVNCRIPDSFFVRIQKPNLMGSTLLHFAVQERNVQIFNFLMEKGADYTIRNDADLTVLHESLNISYDTVNEIKIFQIDSRFVDAVLQAHLKDDNFENPCDKNGVSHFHVACMENNVKTVELFLKNGVPVNQTINVDSPVFPGYTPLHFATWYGSVETADVLMRYNANLHHKDKSGATPLRILMQKNLKLIEQKNMGYDYYYDMNIDEVIEKNENVMKSLLNISEGDENITTDESGLSTFHVVCTLQDTSLTELLLKKITDLEQSIKSDSLSWSGYTALHFAALSNIHMVKLLLKNGANIEAKDTHGTTPFDICLERYKINDIAYIISCHSIWKDISFSDSEVKLVDFIDALQNNSKLIFWSQNFIINSRLSLPLDCPLWPGYTPLHLAVIIFDRDKAIFNTKEEDEVNSGLEVIRLFLNSKYFEPIADVLAQDAYGRTPIHLAFQMQKRDVVRLLFEHNDKIENPVDINNLSLLHIACLENENLVEELLFIGEDANMAISSEYRTNELSISAGSTALHIAVLKENNDLIKQLLTSGADPFAQDANGIAPIHQVLALDNQAIARNFILYSNLQNVVAAGGVTYLHIACIADEHKAVKKLLELGADINAPIMFELAENNYSLALIKLLTPYVGSPPLHFALSRHSLSAVEILLARDADVFVKKAKDPPLIYEILVGKNTEYANVYTLFLRYNDSKQMNLKNLTELTMLHIACSALDLALVKYLLENGSDVNAQAYLDSPVFPGCTPLHVLLNKIDDNLGKHGSCRNFYIDQAYIILKLLMIHGADITLMNAERQTPIDLSKKIYRIYIRNKSWLCTMLPLGNYDYYDLNFVDDKGISLFHEACYQNNIPVIKEFLKRGVDVNQQVHFSGYTPLHFATKQRCHTLIGSSPQMMTVDLLLNHGANINMRDAHGNTPLHVAAENGSSRKKLLSKFIKFGADINAVNIYGNTPLEVLLMSKGVNDEEVTIFLENGASINSYNIITKGGYIPLVFDHDYESTKVNLIISSVINKTSNVAEADNQGRTIIHNIASSEAENISVSTLSSLFVRFVEQGCDLDQQDQLGKTPLHAAVEWKNSEAVISLLKLNANASIVDKNGKSAMDYIFDYCNCEEPCRNYYHERMRSGLMSQVHRLELVGSQEFNNYKDSKIISHDKQRKQFFSKELKKIKKMQIIPKELTLYDFMSETGAVSSYLHMPLWKRSIVDKFFAAIDNLKLHKVNDWLKHHYRKALARPTLIEPAKDSLNNLIGFPLPDLCSGVIIRFLSNVELKNLIATSDIGSDTT